MRGKLGATALSTATALCLAGCGGVNGSAPPRRPAVAAPTTPAWEAQFTHPEIADYDAALTSFTQIDHQEEPIWDRGTVTRTARSTFAEDWANSTIPLKVLAMWQAIGIRQAGVPAVLTSQMESYQREEGGAVIQIVIRQCVDSSQVVVTQHGRVEPWRGVRGVRLVDMYGLSSGVWKLWNVVGEGKC